MQCICAFLHGILGSYLRDALHEGSADAVACLPVPRAKVFSSFLLFAWWPPLLFLVRINYQVRITLPPTVLAHPAMTISVLFRA
jgi:hypothetical protein